MSWIGEQAADDLAISVLTFGELRRGVAGLAPGRQRTALSSWMAEGLAMFGDRILLLDIPVAQTWGDLSASLKRTGRAIGVADEIIAATALTHGLTLVTRNQRHFEATGCDVISPWSLG